MAIPVAINRLAAFLVPKATAEARAGVAGFIKLIGRYGPGGKAFSSDAAMFLTAAEQSALFGLGRRLLIWSGGSLFLVGAVLDTVRNLISPGEEKRTIGTRLEMIQAHLVKGGPVWTRAIGIAEQVLFILTDAAGEAVGDVLAGVLSTLDPPEMSPPLLATFFDRNYYAELATPVGDLDAVDSIIEAPGLILQPAIVPNAPMLGETFPGPPMPSWGRRS